MKSYLSLIKFSHTVFALPFACIGLALGFLKTSSVDWLLAFKVLLCMVFARSAAMAFNRWADANYDKMNPRTAVREIPAGILSSRQVVSFIISCCLAFICTTYFINTICFYLSPVALLVILGYSYTKRWTFLCHLFLGAGLALAPIGAYLAVTGVFHYIPLLFSICVFLWVAGFDIIYALQDSEFDATHGLFSIPGTFGRPTALVISRVIHGVCAMTLIAIGVSMDSLQQGPSYLLWVAIGFFMLMLIYQHLLVKPNDLSRVNIAFFTTNGVASVVFGLLMISYLVMNK